MCRQGSVLQCSRQDVDEAGGTHLHTDPSVWELGSQRAWLTYAMSVVLVPRGERNGSWHRMSLRWSSRNQLPWLAF